MRTILATLAVILMLLASGCVSSESLRPPDSQLAGFTTIALVPVTFSSEQTLPNERVAIATVLEKALTAQLDHKGYSVVAGGAKTASASLHIDITYVWDARIYGDERLLSDRLYPELTLYADVTLTDLASGKVVLRKEVQASGLIEPFASPVPEARYTAPQRNLARRISQLFPSR